ncbi:MAG: MarR family winged helix-turn-helix transcriptional regulator [Streptosporangiaceae bacterium]
MTTEQLTAEDFSDLLEFRTSLRRFQRWSERQAKGVGLTPAQHQLLLAVKGHAHRRGPSIGDLAGYLLLRHHSAVELVNRVEASGLVRRARDPDDARVVRITLTRRGEGRLERLATLHLTEIRRLAPLLEHLVVDLDHEGLSPA